MIEQTINEWLSDFDNISLDDYYSHSTVIVQNNAVISALYSYLEDVNKFQKVIQIVKVCDVLFKYYRSSEPALRQFTLQFLPQLLYTYLNAVAHSDKKTIHVMETLIVGIYNLEIVEENGQPKVLSFRLPSLAQSSIYHEPVSLAPAYLTESALKRLEQRDSQLVRWGPLQPVEKLIAQNRLSILSELLFCYNRQIDTLSKFSIEKLCKVTTKIVNQGFSKSHLENYRRLSISVNGDNNIPSVMPRITVTAKFLCQILYSLYFAMFNGFKYDALQAIEAVAVRASYQGLNEVILLTNAIKNCNYLLSTEQSETAPMGISVSVSSTVISTTTTTALSKSMITNASFRTKKLPDDIPIQDPQQQDSTDSLGAITEEKDDNSNTPEIHPRRSLPRMAANFGKKTKEKIAIAVKSGSVTGMKSLSKNNSILINGDASETDENGIELGSSDVSNLSGAEGEDASTPYNTRKVPQSVNTIDMDVSRSVQVSSV